MFDENLLGVHWYAYNLQLDDLAVQLHSANFLHENITGHEQAKKLAG